MGPWARGPLIGNHGGTMKLHVLLIGILASMPAWGADEDLDLIDICGKLTHKSGYSEVVGFDREDAQKTERKFKIMNSEAGDDMSVEELQKRIPDGGRQCVRGWKKNDTTILLYDFFSFQNEENIIDCVVNRVVDDSVFEEGLSRDEYPNVSVTRVTDSDEQEDLGLSVSIGAMRNYRDTKGDTITVSPTPGRVTVRAKYQDGGYDVKITRTNSKRSRKYVGYLDVDGSLVAYLSCK